MPTANQGEEIPSRHETGSIDVLCVCPGYRDPGLDVAPDFAAKCVMHEKADNPDFLPESGSAFSLNNSEGKPMKGYELIQKMVDELAHGSAPGFAERAGISQSYVYAAKLKKTEHILKTTVIKYARCNITAGVSIR